MKKVFLGVTLGAILTSLAFGGNTMDVYKSQSCGCCGAWGDIMKKSGFEVKEHFTEKLIELKATNNVPLELASCHTAVIDGYVVEGHVPASDIKRLLELKPADVVGISVPGMPLGSPGMEQGGIVEDYDVIAFKKDGSYEIFASYKKGKRVR